MAEPEIQEYVCEMIPVHGGRYLGHVRHKERITRCRDCRYHAGTFCKLHEVMMPDPCARTARGAFFSCVPFACGYGPFMENT